VAQNTPRQPAPEQHLNTFYTKEKLDLVRQIFESLHSLEYRENMR
jgi:hypothetical protein